jgi:pilus assembly protein TadC
MNVQQQDSGLDSVKVRRGKVDSLSLYEVTESELQDLERGGPASLFLNFAIFLLSTAVSFLVALLSTDIKLTNIFIVFVLVTLVGFVGGGILLLIWNRSRQSTKEIIQRIKDRMPKEYPADLDAQQKDSVDKK